MHKKTYIFFKVLIVLSRNQQDKNNKKSQNRCVNVWKHVFIIIIIIIIIMEILWKDG